jgi:hypothetical protein
MDVVGGGADVTTGECVAWREGIAVGWDGAAVT